MSSTGDAPACATADRLSFCRRVCRSVGRGVLRRWSQLGRAWTERWERPRQEFLARWGTAPNALWAIQTRSRVDVGRWFRLARLWVVCRPDEVVLWAHGPRPFLRQWRVAELTQSFYNAISGELVLTPSGPEASRMRLRLAPLEAYRILEHISGAESRSPRQNLERFGKATRPEGDHRSEP